MPVLDEADKGDTSIPPTTQNSASGLHPLWGSISLEAIPDGRGRP